VQIDLGSKVADQPMLCNRDALVGACTNLVNNSIEAGAKHISVALHQQENELTIRVSDDGPGFSADQTSQMLEAFYTTKSHGTGLGLAVVQAVVNAHQGSFDIESPAKGGATATLSLPLLRASSSDRQPNHKK